MAILAQRGRTFALALALLLPALPLSAQTAPMKRVRGTIVSLAGPTLVVRSREGDDLTITLKDGYAVTGLDRASLADIKPGDFVGVASLPQPGGTLKALEVLIFPAGIKPGEGHRAWDLLPESTMTNATVADTVQGVSGRTLTLSYQGGKQTVEVPTDAPVVKFAPADKADLKPGAPVFLSAERGSDGTLSAARITVGNHGVAPPM